MTRFARAKGSKASNQRVPEDATSWQEMKQGMQDRKNIEGNEEDLLDARNSNNDSNHSKSKDECISASSKWSDIPIMDIHKKSKPNDVPLKKKKGKNKNNTEKCENLEIKTVNDNQGSGLSMSKSETLIHERNDSEIIKKKKSKKCKRDKSIEDDNSQIINKKKKIEHRMDDGKVVKHHKKKEAQPEITATTKNKTVFKKDKQKEFQRRKPNSQLNTIFINGNRVEIEYYDGFPIKKEDAERLKSLKKEMVSKGLPKSEVAHALKLERRKAEKALAREKKKVCFNCRSSGHTLSECPSLKSESNEYSTETGICFKCGSTEHTHFECKVIRGDNFKFAQCFICKEQGHIARQCPDNNRGLYPKGGACRVCGDVTHLKKDCPKYKSQQEENKVVAHTLNDQNIESLENEPAKNKKKSERLQKIIKF